MTNARNTNKTVANQYLNPIIRIGAKPLMLLSILLTAMFILAACGGGAAAPAAVTPTADPCRGNPFGGTCTSAADQTRRTTVVQLCLDEAMVNTPVCAQAIVAEPCLVNPLGKDADGTTDCSAATEFIAYLPTGTGVADVVSDRADFCKGKSDTANANICTGVQNAQNACTAAAPFANALCDDVTGIAGLRTTYCNADATLWNDDCDAGEATYTGATEKRNMACLESGVTADASCASRANVREACNADPFTQTTTTNADLCTGSTADTGGTTYADARAACAVAATSFAENCDSQDTIGDVKLARDMACAESGTTADDTCNVRPNIIADCDADDPFANTGCDTAAHILADSNAIRTTYCTADATTFDADCTDGTDGMVNDARARVALACNVEVTTGIDGCDTFANGVDGATVATCSANPFSGTDGCGANIAFNGIRTGICTTEATSFNPNCADATYAGSAAVRAALIAKCANPTTAGDCTTTFIDGSDTGTTVAMCFADPFNTDCGANNVVDDSFATARDERNTLCAATGSPFDALCVIDTFANSNDANRDTYCLTIALENDVDCAGTRSGGDTTDRLAEICGATDTHNPFALLCGDNTANRMTFCGLGTQSGNLDCLTDEAMLCARNPFGTNLGPAATVDCIAPSTGSYAAERLALAEACRTGATPANGATCTVAIDRCNANPFSDTVFNGGECDRVAFEGAHAPYCAADANPWQTNCDTVAMENGSVNAVDTARTTVCLENRAIITNTVTLAAGDSLFNDALCGAVVITSGTTIAEARTAWCTVGDNIFDTDCGDDDADTFGATTAARQTACETTADAPLTSVGTNNCVSRADDICGTDGIEGDNPFAAICAVATQNVNNSANYLDAQQYYCSLTANNALQPCEATIAGVCGATDAPITTTTAIFDRLCLAAEYLAAQRTYCSVTALDGDTDCDKTQPDATASIKDTLCDGTETTDTPHAMVCGTANLEQQRTFCGLTDNSAATGCAATIAFACDEATTTGNPFHVLCSDNEADRILRADECRGGNSAGKMCDTAVDTCNGAPFTAGCDAAVYVNALTAYCTEGDNIFDVQCVDGTHGAVGAVNNARLARCAGPIADLGRSAVDATCFTESVAICGTMTVEGTSPFAEICGDANRNMNHADLAAIQGFYCGNNARRPGCPDDTDNSGAVTSGDFARGQATPLRTDPTNENQFLEIAVDSSDISTTGTLTETAGGGTAPTPTTLDFSELEYGGQPLSLEAADGVAFFTGFHGNTEYAYAGIFGTTDLGAPIATNTTATWNGLLNINGTEQAFDLEVVFSDSADNTVKGFAINPIDTKDFLVDGTFDANGVITGNVHYDEFASDTRLNISAPNGVLSGLIGTDGAVGVFYNTAGDLYVGGFVVSPDLGICTTNVFDPLCPVYQSVPAQTAFCVTAVNIFNPLCIEATHGTTDQLKGLRDAACLARGDMADGTCKNREEVRMACNTNVYTQTTGLDTNINLCTGTATDGGEAYSARQTACQAAATTFAQTWCNGGDTSVAAVNSARNSYCGDKARSESDGTGNGNCVSRLAATCTTNDGTAPFSGICGTAVTPQQITACSGTLGDLTTKGAVASDCNNALLSGAICGDASSMGGSNPFAPICSEPTATLGGFVLATAQLAICGGSVSDLTDGGAQLSDCRTNDLSGAICGTSTTVGSDPFAPICGESSAIVSGFVLATAQLTICGGELTGFDGAAEVTDCKTPALAGVICGMDSTPGSDPFAPICGGAGALASYDQAAAQFAICSGSVTTLTSGNAVASDCKTNDLAGAICGDLNSNPGSDPFAPICSESDAIIGGFVLATAQLAICGGELTGFNGAAEVGDCKIGGQSTTICGMDSSPGTDPFAPICGGDGAPPDGIDLAAAQLAICGGPINELTDGGAQLSDCKNGNQSTTICGAGSNPGSNPFAPICGGAGAPDGFDLAAAQLTICGGPINELTDGGAQLSDCKNGAQSNTICGTGSSPGSDPFAPICVTAGAPDGIDLAAAQLAICSGALAGFAGNADVSDCKTGGQSATICGDGTSAPGTNPWAYICGQSTAIIDGFTQATAQDRACLAKGATDAGTGNNCAFRTAVLSACDLNPYEVATDTNADLCAASTSTTNGETYLVRRGICEDKTTTFTETYCGPNDKAVGGTDTAVKDVRDEICLEQEAGDINSGDNNCMGRANVNAACLPADPFLHVGCSSADNIAGTRTTYCTTGTKIFDPECNNDAYGAAGVTTKARATACTAGTAVHHETGNAITTCGSETVAGIVFDYCATDAGLTDTDSCPVKAGGEVARVCRETNPWGTGCSPTSTTYHAERKARCASSDPLPSGVVRATVCPVVLEITCRTGGGSITANPFDATCLDGATYTPDRLARCEVDAVETITGLGGTCSGAGLSDVICGSSASESGSNPFAPICDSSAQNANFANLDRAKQLSCGATRLGAGATNKGVCDTLQDGLCTGANSVSATPQGAGNFVCSTDSEPNVVLARNNFCQDPATTYATGCTTAIGTTLATRRTLATSCVEGGSNFPQSGTADAVCNQEVAAGLTVAACSANPYLDACEVVGVKEAFTTVLTARDNLCTTSVANSDPFNALCGVFPTRNVQLVDYCDEPATAWEGRCVGGGLVDINNAIANARANVCINNLAITTNGGTDVAAGSSLFSSRCDGLSVVGGTTVTATRLPLCAGALNLLSTAGGNATLCNSAELSGVICGTLGDTTASNVYAPICSDQLALTSGYTVADVNARRTDTCLATAVAGRDPSCGSETPNSGYIGTYCAGDNNSAAADNARDCPNTAYLRKNPTVTTALTASALGDTGANSALNSDGTARLTGENVFLTAQLNAGDTDAATNFANIGAATFEKGDVNELISLKLDAVGGQQRYHQWLSWRDKP